MRVLKSLLFLAVVSGLWARDVKVYEVRDFRHRDLSEQGISLKKDLHLKIEAWGMSGRWDENLLAYGWIVDSQTRKVVWKMTTKYASERRRDYRRKVEEEIQLPAGQYEVYFTGYPRWGNWGRGYRDFGDFLSDLFGGFQRNWRTEAKSWGLALSVDEKDQDAVALTGIPEDGEGTIVQLIALGDDEFEKQGFSLSRETRIRVYAVGEGDDGEMYDYGWIVDASSGDKVWEMKYRATDWAGGAEKNRTVDETMTLPKGDYMVYFVTDGSHSYDEWNRLPPHDPRYCGITLWGVEQGFQKDLVVKPYDLEKNGRTIVDITRVDDDRFEEEQFTLTKPARVRIRCLGEYGYSDRFVDYGYILDAKTRETIWEMKRRNTDHAGGAKKNRMFDGVVSLKPGNYEVYYVTDGSHSYRRWNAGPPYNPEAWGISLWGVGEDFDPESVTSYREEENPDLLVQIVRVGDHERIRRRFSLTNPTRVRIYAIGEGDDDEMYDYGWIENERGRIVWKMEYWDTERAGGAKKNRMVNEVVRLDEGDYEVRYRTDGSHSFEDWNASPPLDPAHYGITVWIER